MLWCYTIFYFNLVQLIMINLALTDSVILSIFKSLLEEISCIIYKNKNLI